MTWVSDGEELGRRFRIYPGIKRLDIGEEIKRRIGSTEANYYMYAYATTGEAEEVEYEFRTLSRKEVDLEEYVVWDPEWEEWRIPTNLKIRIEDFFVDKTWEDVPPTVEEINRISREMEGYVLKEPIVNVTTMEENKILIVFEHPRYTERNCWWRRYGEMPRIVDARYEVFKVLKPDTKLERDVREMLEGCNPLICYRLRWVK